MAQTYLLCGYHVPSDGCDPHCLLYDEMKKTFKTKRLKQKLRGCFRSAFGSDLPFRGSRVADNAYTGGIKLVSDKWNDSIDDIPYTTLSERAVDKIFQQVPNVKSAVRDDCVPYWTKMTEKKFVLETAFKKNFLRAIRVSLISYLKLEKNPRGDYYLPHDLRSLFIVFDSVDFCGHDPERIIIRHKLIKYVLEEACPFIKVALFGSLGLEMALAMSLPTGSTGKGVEIFQVHQAATGEKTCLEVSDHLAFDGSDFSLVTDKTSYTCLRVPPMPEDESYFDWLEMSSIATANGDIDGSFPPPAKKCKTHPKKKSSDFFHDIEGQLALLGSVHKPEETTDFFQKGAVVFATHGKTDGFACLDFSNFYASVVIKFGLDSYVVEVMKRLVAWRNRFKTIKAWIVSILGKSKHLDPFFYNRMKALSVAVVLSTIDKNSGSVTGATTDGLLVNPEVISTNSFWYPDGFPIKKEFVPAPGTAMVSEGTNRYAGICSETGEVVHRGFIGRLPGKHPEWYREIIAVLLRCCLSRQIEVEEAIRRIEGILERKGSRTKQYVLPDTHAEPLPVRDKQLAVEYFGNNLCTGLCQVYAVIDDHVLPAAALAGGHQPPLTQSALSVKLIDVSKYVAIFEDSIRRVATVFSDEPDLVSLCERAFGVVKEHVTRTLPYERAVYPGGTDYA